MTVSADLARDGQLSAPVAMPSLRTHMEGIPGFATGFDYLRFCLSISVLVWHSFIVTQGIADALVVANSWSGFLTYWILPMFFALSGFLVASSLERTPSLKKFLWLRLIRIYPALAVEVVLSAFLLGAFVTTLPIKEYLTDHAFIKYFLNTLGYIHYELPGVFKTNPYPNIVNGSLWTVPYELECYLAISVLSLLAVRKRPGFFLILFAVALLAKTASTFHFGYEAGPPANLRGRLLVLFFLAGVLIYLNRHRIPYNRMAAFGCLIVGGCCLYSDQFVYLAPLPVAYVTIWLGLQRPKKIPVLMDGDYSYGIYLYACPIQQAAWYLTDFGKTYAGNIMLSLLCVSIFAAFSWHWIEKPMLQLKKWF